METISLPQLQEMFAGLRGQETGWNIDSELPWGYYFTSTSPESLEKVADALAARKFAVTGIFEGDEGQFILQSERIEQHTPESLFALNAELNALAGQFPGVEYDGMDVNPHGEEGDCCCDGECDDCDCEDGHEDHACCGGGEEHECGCGGGSRHYHPESEPVENPELLAAIRKIASDQSAEAQQELTMALQRGLYLVPVFTGRIDTDPADDEALQVLVCTDQNDAEFLPLFTDEDSLKAWTSEEVSAMVLTAPEAWDLILTQPECAGGVINPGQAALPLNREMVTLLQKMIDPA